MEEFEGYLRRKGYSANTVASYMFAVRQLRERVDRLTDEALFAHKDWLIGTYAAKTVNNRLIAINTYLNFVGYEGIRLAGVKIQQKPFLDNVVSNSQYEAMKAQLKGEDDPFWLFVIRFLACTGARVSELRRFTVEHVRTGHMDIVSKGSKLRRVYVPAELQRDALAWLEAEGRTSGEVFLGDRGTVITARGIALGLKRVAARCGVDEAVVYPHSFRHLFAKNFIKRSPDIALLADLMGHESIETTRVYLRRTAQEQRDEVNAVVDW